MLTLAVILLFVGLVLLALEILVIPGFGLFGFTGVVTVAVSLGIIMSVPGITGTIAFMAAIALAVLAMAIVFLIIRYKRPPALILGERLSSTVAQDLDHLLGVSGVALTTLRPAGTAELQGKRWTVVTEGEFVPKGRKITVIQVEGQRIVVEKAEN